MPSQPGSALFNGFKKSANAAADYFQPWTYDVPLAIRQETNDRLVRVQRLFHRCVRHLAERYDRYLDLMPLPPRVADILSAARTKPYRAGTCRTDFIVDQSNHVRLIETTCRFAMNGYFTSGFFIHNLADRFLARHPEIRKIDAYTPFFDRFIAHFRPFDHVCLLKGADNRNDTRFVIPVFEKAGIPVQILPAAEIPARTRDFIGAAVLGELSHDEICALPDETIEAIVAADSMNDLRTVFLIHDKRFYALLSRPAFLNEVLSPVEIDEFRPFLVPTYAKNFSPEIWPLARNDKNRWILKPFNVGKSIDVFAGPLTDAAEWHALFDSGRADRMVLQEYVPQRTFSGSIGNQSFNDFAAGTLLFFDEDYFGPGLFRASSYPVTNKVDDRKIAPLVTPDAALFEPDNAI